MKKSASETITLTQRQRRLVQDNIGLVGLHLERALGERAWRSGRWDDLFQEGCLGLITAAVRFRRRRGIAFPAFALKRIQKAVHRALRTKWGPIVIPAPRQAASPTAPDNEPPVVIAPAPRFESLTPQTERKLSDRRARPAHCVGPEHDSGPSDAVEGAGELIGERLRDKYERAVRAAVTESDCRSSTR